MPEHDAQFQSLQELHRMLRNGPYDDASFLARDGSASRLVLNSFTGTDITCHLVMPTPPGQDRVLREMGMNPDEYDLPAMKTFAELQTLTISSARSVFGVRRLGEAHIHQYTRGARTIAGTMVFTTFTRDVFAEFYRVSGYDSFNDRTAPFFVDQMPPFHLLISAHNEYGLHAQAALINVTLSNFGTTMSIHDLQLESTYTYVAQFFFPFVQDYRAFQSAVMRGAEGQVRPLSSEITRQLDSQANNMSGMKIAAESIEEVLANRVARRLLRGDFLLNPGALPGAGR